MRGFLGTIGVLAVAAASSALGGCCSGTSAEVWSCTEPMVARDQAQAIEVVQDTGSMSYQTLAHIRAGGNVRAFEAMERLKDEARQVGADALTNVHRVTGSDVAIYEGDAIAWLPR